MPSQTIKFSAKGPILPGNAYPSRIKCGKKYCMCAKDAASRHIVYQWSGNINGRNTTRTLTQEMYKECVKRIENYRAFKKAFLKEAQKALTNAPWKKKRSR